MSDVQVLEWLDRLLALDLEERAATLQRLCMENPTLHARLVRLLAAALTVESSQLLQGAVRQGVCEAARWPGAPALRANHSVAGYRLVRELGRGGMATVWLAERLDGVIKRPVAMKLPLFSVGSPVAVARFIQEKDVLAGLAHPHIARLYDAGIADGQQFIVLEYIDGVPITEYCDSKNLDIPSRLRLFLQVLEAVDHAHKHLVVHRDLKPSNILVDIQGQVKLLDFGISKLMLDPTSTSQAVELTQLGDTVLTPAYAAPEQARGEGISTLTDVFVLGVVLHELLSGALPYANRCGSSPTVPKMIDALLRGSPTRPSQAPIDEVKARARAVPTAARLQVMLQGDLDTIVHKALQYDPEQRYGSAENFAEDLRRFLTNRPVAARTPGIIYLAGLFLRRNRAVSMAGCIGAVLSLIGAVTALQQYSEARASAERATAVRDFMFDFVNDAEPNESESASQITGRQMLDGAVERARQNFPDKPQLRGELLGELGRMYLRFEEPELASRIMAEALQVLEGSATSSDPALNNTRAQLSGVLVRQNKLSEAREMAMLVLDNCRRGTGCARARYVANTILADTLRFEGRIEESLRAMRQAVNDAAEGFGEQHTDTTEALARLAVMLRGAGQVVEAGTVIERAVRQSARQTLRKVERIRLLRWQAMSELDLGRYDSALERLRDLIPQSENRDDRAVLLRTLAGAYLAKGEPAAALESVEAAIHLLDKEHSGADLLYAAQVRAQALVLLGRAEESLAEIGRVIEGLLQMGRSPQSPEVRRACRIRSEILLRNGRAAEALQALQSLRDQLLALSEARPLDLAQTLDLLGCAQRELGLSRQAVQSHRAAAMEFRKILPADHPFLARNTLYSMAAANDRERFEQQAARIKLALGPNSIWHQIIDMRTDPSACRAAPTAVCTLVL